MTGDESPQAAHAILPRARLGSLLEVLRSLGYTLVGPTIRDGAIVYAEITGVDDLPAGWTEEQEAGTYRLRRRDDEALFGYAVGPHSWKQFSFVPRLRLWQARRDGIELHRRAGDRASRRASRSSARAPATCTPSRSRTGPSSAARIADPDYAARRADAVRRRGELRAGRRHLLLRLDGDRPAGDGRLRPRADRAPGRAATASWSRSAASAARRCWRALAAEPATDADRRTRRGGRRAHRAPPWAARSTPPASRSCSTRNCEHPRWDDVADALPRLRQLHAGLPDLLLRHRRGHDRPDRRPRRALARAGTRASRSTSPTSTAAACAPAPRSRYRQWLTHKLATLDRPVRHVGLRRLRPLHHLVPGRHRPHRRGRAPSVPATRRRSGPRGSSDGDA